MIIVEKNRITASLFLPSAYNIIGLPRTKKPVKDAENTNSIKKNIGVNRLSPIRRYLSQ